MIATKSLLLLSALLLTGPFDRPQARSTSGATSGPPASAELQMSQVFLIHDVPAAAQETGLLEELLVEEGAEVKRGQLLARIDDRQAVLEKEAAERQREAAMTKATNDTDVQFAIKSYELAKTEWADSVRINGRSPGTVGVSEIRRLALARDRAELQIMKSQLDMKVAKLNADTHQAAVDAAEEKIRRRRITAPFDGVVIDIQKQQKQWVTAGEAVMRVVRLDRLRVDGLVNAAELDANEVDGKQVSVFVTLARGRTAKLQGRIVFTNQLIQAGNRFRVRAEVENRRGPDGQWLLQPGKAVRTVVHLR